MGSDFIMGFGLAILGGVLVVMSLPTVRRWRLPSLDPQRQNPLGRIIRGTVSIFAFVTGVPAFAAGLAIVGGALVGVRFVLPM
jgi:hypothetical protein